MYIAIMGYGVVGSGAAEVLKMNNEKICLTSGQEKMELKYILDLRSFPGDPNEKLVTNDFNVILNDPEVEIVIETMGGLHPAYDFVVKCLEAGKSVVTSNKELVAEKGFELLQTARTHKVNFMFEAAVGGGIPILRPINRCLTANRIIEVAGILNGTTNFILTKMFSEGTSFEDALATAQELGYAEKNPSADVDGLDSCRKICILADLCFGKNLRPALVHTEGIRNIGKDDVELAESKGYVIKLIGSAREENGKVQAMVSPAMVSADSPLAAVSDVYNAILVRGNAVGTIMFYGHGAGKMATASAVISDVIDCAVHSGKPVRIGWKDDGDDFVASYCDFTSSFYVRLTCENEIPADMFENAEIIKLPDGDTAVFTGKMKRSDLDGKLAALGSSEVHSVIRITDY